MGGDPVVTGVIFACAVVVLFAFTMWIRQRQKNEEPMRQADKEEAPADREFIPEEVGATVIDYGCGVTMVGLQTPKTVKDFTVVFQTDVGEILKLQVPEEMYDGFEKGQRGVLSLVDGVLYSFVPDED